MFPRSYSPCIYRSQLWSLKSIFVAVSSRRVQETLGHVRGKAYDARLHTQYTHTHSHGPLGHAHAHTPLHPPHPQSHTQTRLSILYCRVLLYTRLILLVHVLSRMLRVNVCMLRANSHMLRVNARIPTWSSRR